MPSATDSVRMVRRFKAPAELVWALLADTNRWHRAFGLNPSTYEYQVVDGERKLVGRSWMYVFRFSFVEVGEWYEGGSLWGERRFLDGLLERAGLRLSIRPVDDGCEVLVELYTQGSGLVGRLTSRWWRGRFRKRVPRVLDAAERALVAAGVGGVRPSGPVWPHAEPLLLAAPQAGAAAGPASPVDEAVFAERAAAFTDSQWVDAALGERVATFLRSQSDEQLRQIRPFRLADAWGLDRREVLTSFLHAARAGLVDLVWQLNCPLCRVAASSARRLPDIPRAVHCDECDIAYDVDFTDNVEAVFTINDAVRRIERKPYCAGSPWFRPHVFAVVMLAPGEDKPLPGPLPDGPILVRALGTRRQLKLGEDERAGEVSITDHDLVMASTFTGELRFRNLTARDVLVLVERAGWSAEIVRGSLMLTLPTYLGLFGAEAPAAGHEIKVGTLCVLFADVVASTSLYERLGDARGYALVQAHFREAEKTVARHDGAVVKTLGDGLLACFAHAGDGMAAALELVERAEELAQRLGVADFAVRVGLHEGPCFIVRANDRIDLFGTTVNLAARLEAEAGSNEVVALAETLARERVQPILASRLPEVERLQTRLRGLRGHYSLGVLRPASEHPQ